MELSFKPDKKYFTKVLWIQLTISFLSIILCTITHIIIDLANGKLEAAYIIWIIVILSLILMWIMSTIISYLWIKNLEYIVNEDRVIIKKGILTKTQQNIPFRAITDFALERTIYDRFLGLGSIKIQTAGQSNTPTGYEGKLCGLVEYEKWHASLREKVKFLHPVSQSVTTVEAAHEGHNDIFVQILNELKKINRKTTK